MAIDLNALTPDWQSALMDYLARAGDAEKKVRTFYERFTAGLGMDVVRHCQANNGKPVSPDEVPWERLMLAGMWAAQIAGNTQAKAVLQFSPAYKKLSQDQLRALATSVTSTLLDAVPYLWLNSTRMAAMNSGDLPRFKVSKEQFPFPAMWWTFETDLKIDPGTIFDERDNDVSSEYAGHSLLLIAPDALPNLNVGPVAIQILTHTKNYQSDFNVLDPVPLPAYGDYLESGPHKGHAEGIFKLLAFAQSPYLTTYRHRSDRGERRRFERLTDEVKPDVHVVVLRSMRARPGSGDGERESPDWSCRWMVRGHYRNQWYRREQRHRLIWVAPYVKGPEDKPFKATVYEVAR